MPVQSHVHLQGIDDRPWDAPENAPESKYRVTLQGYSPRPSPYIAVDKALNGTPHVHRLAISGVPVVYTDYGHLFIVTCAEFPGLLSELGKNVDYVDSDHPNDGSDHSEYVHEKVFTSMKIQAIDPALKYYLVSITLEDVEAPS